MNSTLRNELEFKALLSATALTALLLGLALGWTTAIAYGESRCQQIISEVQRAKR